MLFLFILGWLFVFRASVMIMTVLVWNEGEWKNLLELWCDKQEIKFMIRVFVWRKKEFASYFFCWRAVCIVCASLPFMGFKRTFFGFPWKGGKIELFSLVFRLRLSFDLKLKWKMLSTLVLEFPVQHLSFVLLRLDCQGVRRSFGPDSLYFVWLAGRKTGDIAQQKEIKCLKNLRTRVARVYVTDIFDRT